MKNDKFEIEKMVGEICQSLENIVYKNSRKDDTISVKRALIEVANSHDINVWTQIDDYEIIENQTHLANHEWLYDLIWYKYNKTVDYALTDLFLAMESEWGGRRYSSKNDKEDPYGEVKYDFQKLLVCNATIKLLVFKEHGNEDETNKLFSYFQDRINECSRCISEEIYLIAIYKKYPQIGYKCHFTILHKHEK